MAIPKINFNKLGNRPNLQNLVPYVLERYNDSEFINKKDRWLEICRIDI